MSANITDTWKVLGRELCRPVGDARLSDYATIGFNDGWLVICDVLQNQSTGEIIRRMLRAKDLNIADSPMPPVSECGE